MTIFYSAKTNGFYDTQINDRMPDDVVEITDLQHNDLLVAQENGKRIQANSDGFPIAVDPPGPTPEEIAKANKTQASRLLTASDWATKPSIADPAQSTPYLTNQQEFFSYQNQLRAIAVNPPTTPVEAWPTLPKAAWSAA